MSNEMVPGLATLIQAVASAVSFECDITDQQSGNVPMFSQTVAFENFKPVIDYNGSNTETSQGKHRVMDVVLYPRRNFDYVAEHSRTVSELELEALKKIGGEILVPLISANQIHATSRSFVLPDERPATFIRVFSAKDYPCHEHPEMLLGQPLGMYHCPACGEMQMAGCFHLDREFDDEGNPTDQQ